MSDCLFFLCIAAILGVAWVLMDIAVNGGSDDDI